MNKSDNLCIEYAQNRIDLKSVRDEIESFNNKHNYSIDITGYRDEHRKSYPDFREGWESCLNSSEDEFFKGEMELAKMLDRKKKIIGDAGAIKRRIYLNGKTLITNNQK